MSFDRAEYMRKWSKRRYQKRRSEGICTRCGKVPERCGEYQELTCNDCIKDWLGEEGNESR